MAGNQQQHGDTELADIVRHFPRARVLVVGDVILDRYVTGAVSRLSPEAPIPVLRPDDRRATLGGSANVALNVATLGGHAILVGVIGADQAGADIEQLLAAHTTMESGLVTAAGRPTTAKTRFMAGSHQLLRLDEEVATPLDPAAVAAVLAKIDAALPRVDIVVLSDYAKGVLCDAVLEAALAMAAKIGRAHV